MFNHNYLFVSTKVLVISQIVVFFSDFLPTINTKYATNQRDRSSQAESLVILQEISSLPQ